MRAWCHPKMGPGGGDVEGSNMGSSNPKKRFLTPEQVAAAAEKKKRKKLRQKANRAAKKQAEQLALSLTSQLQVSLGEVTPEQTPKKAVKRSAEVLVSHQVKVPKLETLPSARILAGYLSQVYELAHLHRGAMNPLFWHGPIGLAELRDVAHSYSAHKEGAFEEATSLGPPGCSLRDEQGLLLLALRSTEPTSVSPAQASTEERSGAELAPLTFFSSELLSYGQRIAHGKNYRCTQCQSSHFPPTRTKIVLVTGSEVIAAAGLPHILTLPGSAAVATHPVAPHQCWDTVWILGGLRSDPYKVLKGIYGTYKGSLKFLLDMGALPVVHGESASSVITRLNALVSELKKSLRLWALGPTQVIILPPIVHLGDENLALHQSPAARTYSKLALTQLTILQRHIEARTSEMLGGMTRSPIHNWGSLASNSTSEMAEDSMGRIVEKVQVTGNSSVVVDGGCLHLKPDSLTATIRSLASFVGAHAWATW